MMADLQMNPSNAPVCSRCGRDLPIDATGTGTASACPNCSTPALDQTELGAMSPWVGRAIVLGAIVLASLAVVGIKVWWDEVQAFKEGELQANRNVKALAAVLLYRELTYKNFPAAASVDKQGKPL